MSDSSIHKDGIYDIDTAFADIPVKRNDDTVFIILLLMLIFV